MNKKAILKIIKDQPDEFYVLYTGSDSEGKWRDTYYFEKQQNRCKKALKDLLKNMKPFD